MRLLSLSEASIQKRTSTVKFARSQCTDPPGPAAEDRRARQAAPRQLRGGGPIADPAGPRTLCAVTRISIEVPPPRDLKSLSSHTNRLEAKPAQKPSFFLLMSSSWGISISHLTEEFCLKFHEILISSRFLRYFALFNFRCFLHFLHL